MMFSFRLFSEHVDLQERYDPGTGCFCWR